VLIYESTLRVPLVIAGPGLPAGTVVAPRVGLADVLPTLLSLVGVDAPPSLPGRDLRGAIAGEPLPDQEFYSESLFGRLNCRWSTLRGLAHGDWKLIEGSEVELFDLARDPSESTDLAAQEPRRVQQMRASLRAAVGRMAPEGDRAQARAASAEQEARLRSLGYVGGGGGAGRLDEPGLPDPRRRVHLYERMQNAMLAQGSAIGGALADMEAVAAEDSGNPFAQMAVGHLAYLDGRLATSEKAFARALELDPDRPAVRAPYGRLLRDLDRLEESERQLRIALEQAPADDVSVRLSLAATLVARGQAAEAEKVIDAILASWPRDAAALAAKGRLLVEQGREVEAGPYLERSSDGADIDDWIALAQVYLGRREATRARESVERALRRSPRHPWALAVAGHALVLEGKPAAGVALARQALALRPRRPAAWLSLAGAFAAAGDEASAARCRRQAEAARRA
jgi:tetratricopeptide (TPR) repeat protein